MGQSHFGWMEVKQPPTLTILLKYISLVMVTNSHACSSKTSGAHGSVCTTLDVCIHRVSAYGPHEHTFLGCMWMKFRSCTPLQQCRGGKYK